MAHNTLVSTAELAAHLSEWRIFDCRHDLDKPELGESQYREAHIPGARFASLDRDLSAPKSGKNGRHPLPDPETFAPGWQRGLAAGRPGGLLRRRERRDGGAAVVDAALGRT